MKNKVFKTLILSIIFSFTLVPVIAFAGDDSVSTDGANVGGADVISIPSTDGANVGGATVIEAPATDGANVGGADVAKEVVIPTTPSQSSNTSSGSSSGGGSVMYIANTLVNSTCPYLNNYLKFGSNNPISEVTKLQTFLKNIEKSDVDINGIFDTKTLEAVKAFQLKNKDRILAPWGASIPSGSVYITTKQVIDEIFCNTKLALTDEKLIEINNYKNGITKSNSVINNTNTEINTNTNNTATTSIDIGQSKDNNSQTAAVANTSFWSRMWKGIKGIFGSK